MKKFIVPSLFFALFFVAWLFIVMVLLSNRFACYTILHKDWVKWEQVVRKADQMKLAEELKFGTPSILDSYEFNSDIDGEPVRVVYWVERKCVSVHNIKDNTCILSSFDKYHGRKMMKIIKKGLENNTFEKDKDYHVMVYQ